MKTILFSTIRLSVLMLATVSTFSLLHAQAPDSAHWRLYLTVTDSIAAKTNAPIGFGYHPRATYGLDTDSMFGFTDHWYEKIGSTVITPGGREFDSPPIPPGGVDLRVDNVRPHPSVGISGLNLLNIHPYTGSSQIDTFVIFFVTDHSNNSSMSGTEILRWASPSALTTYADSMFLVDQVVSGGVPHLGLFLKIDMMKDSLFTYRPDEWYNPDVDLYNVDPRPTSGGRGLAVIVKHPKVGTPAPSTIALVSPPNGSMGRSYTEELVWNPTTNVNAYRVQVSTDRNFSSFFFKDSIPGTIDTLKSLAPFTWYYWRVVGFGPFGISYAQSPPDSFQTGIINAVPPQPRILPTEFALQQNYPNPFNPTTSITYDLPEQAHVTLTVTDVLGREVATLVDEVKERGTWQASWNASGVPSGIYFYRIVAGTFSETRKMEVMK